MQENATTATVKTPAGQEHVHGGTADTTRCHHANPDSSGPGEATTWFEPVTDEQYRAAHTAAGAAVRP